MAATVNVKLVTFNNTDTHHHIAVVGAAATDLVYVTFGSNPTATNAGFLVPSGSVAYFGVGAVSEKVAVLGPA